MEIFTSIWYCIIITAAQSDKFNLDSICLKFQNRQPLTRKEQPCHTKSIITATKRHMLIYNLHVNILFFKILLFFFLFDCTLSVLIYCDIKFKWIFGLFSLFFVFANWYITSTAATWYLIECCCSSKKKIGKLTSLYSDQISCWWLIELFTL